MDACKTNEAELAGVSEGEASKTKDEKARDVTVECSESESTEQGIFKFIEPPEPNEASPDHLHRLDETVVDFMKEQNVPGLCLCISKKGEILYTQAYGYATQTKKTSTSSIFRIASISKTFAAVVLMKLVEDKKLALNDKVFGPKGILSRYSPTPEGDRRVLKIAVKHLMQHSGGWDFDVIEDPIYYRHVGVVMSEPEPVSPDVLIRYMMTQKLNFTPGSKFSYCNFGYMVLSQVIEQITGTTFESYLQNVLKVIDVSSVRVGKTRKEDAFPNEVEYFSFPPNHLIDSVFPGEGRVPTPYGAFCIENDDAVGGLVCNIQDLIKFFHALDGTGPVQLLNTSSIKLMLDRPSYAKGDKWYGLGLDVMDNKKSWEHTGGMDGTVSTLTHDHKTGLTWAAVTNTQMADGDLSSLIKLAVSKVKPWTKYAKLLVPYADIVSKDKNNLFKGLIHEKNYLKTYQEINSQGYQLIYISGYAFKGDVYFNTIWSSVKESVDHQSCAFINLTLTELQEKLSTMHNDGYQPKHIDSYLKNDTIFYAVVFYNNLDISLTLYPDLNENEHNEKLQELKAQSYFLCVQSVVSVNSELHFCVLFEKHSSTNACWYFYNHSKQEYEKEFSRRARYGHLLAYVKAYKHENETKFSTIWTDPGAYRYASCHDVSKYGMQADMLSYADQNFEVSCVSAYEEDFLSFAVVWKKKVVKRKRKST